MARFIMKYDDPAKYALWANAFSGKAPKRLPPVLRFAKRYAIPTIMEKDRDIAKQQLLEYILNWKIKFLFVFGGDGTLQFLIDVL